MLVMTAGNTNREKATPITLKAITEL